jgi:CMP-N-acetylneuraminic acid synthetase
MYKNKKILAIIPARKGSQRIPEKNIKIMAGRPLIYYTIKAALKCPLLDKVIVSTDSPKIAKIAKTYGAEIPFLRPKKYARNASSDQEVARHALNYFTKKGLKFDYCVYLKPTSPLRLAADINLAVKKTIDRKLPLLRTVTRVGSNNHPYWMYKSQGDLLKPLLPKIKLKNYYQSSLLPKNIYYLNGLVEVFSLKQALSSEFLYDAPKIGYLETPEARADDLDTLLDWQLCELKIKKNNL